LPLIAERPLLGYGPESFVQVFNERYPPGSLYDGSDVIVDDPHNLFLELLMATGLVGMLAWLALLGTLAWQIHRRWRSASSRRQLSVAACLSGLVAYLVQAQFTPDVVVVSALFWVLAARISLRADH
jgi:O-antigen ligase